MTSISQNVRFHAVVPDDVEFNHPAGAALIRRLSTDIASSGWVVDEFDNWRDCGWSVICRRGTSVLDVSVAQIQTNEWMLQVNAHRIPGFLGRLFGAEQSATPADVYDLAIDIHRALASAEWLGRPLWRWDGFPEEDHSTPEPRRF
ncbi:MAG TPA: hypothetical protein VNH11_33110 [Pirellulales bacterium]|nr:hypothetical protein [Pirellulales bacterium]